MAESRRNTLAVLALLGLSFAVRAGDIEGPPVNYVTVPTNNVVTRLEQRLAHSQAMVSHDDRFGYLKSVLPELNVPESSQVLVFSKTSLQRHRIAPETPRALYFNDDVYIGYCQQGDVMEVTAMDPNLGAVFYSLDQKNAERPVFTRQNETCMICHGSSQNQGLPGNLVRSTYVDRAGYPILSMGTHRIDDSSPLKDRWGGWYVTGTSGKQTHLGNLVLRDRVQPEEIDNKAGVNVTDLHQRFDTTAYPTPHSDIVALLVLEHQAEMHNRIIRANLLTRMALYEETELNKALGRPADYHSESTTSRIKNACEPLVKYLLFSGAAPLTDRVQGTSGFAEEFAHRGPRDAQGRSLRDFDLERRLFKYPCSYLIYSASFDALPAPAKEQVLRRLWEVLTGKDTSADFAHLKPEDRKAILEILLATKKDLPVYWKAGN